MMEGRYVLSDYEEKTDEKPRIACRTSSLEEAEASFQKSAERLILSAVLYDTKTDEVLKIAINGEPIYLVRAIEYAREFISAVVDMTANRAIKIAAGMAIGKIVAKLAGESIPGVGGAILAHFLAPYYAFKGDAAAAVGACAGLWGGVSGSIVGLLVGGPIGAVVGGIAGGSVAGTGAAGIIKASSPKEKLKCKNCKGAGLVQDYRKCPECEGYGYTD